MWSDNETDVDLLRFRYLASSVTGIVRSPHLLPTTIGVYGDWGSGKSSLLKMVWVELQDDPTVLCLNFNGWLFEGYEDAKTALMGSILEAIEERIRQDETTSEKASQLLERLLKRVNWMQLASLAGRYVLPTLAGQPHLTLLSAGQDIAKSLFEAVKAKDKDSQLSLEDVQKLLKEAPEGAENVRRNIRDFRRDFAQLVHESKIETLVVFIDDLDRCLPDTIIETLEAIKLFLFAEGTVFILGADERLIQYAVRQRFPELPGTETEVGRDYLEKLVQIPVRIPPLSGAEIESYINILFAQGCLGVDDFTVVCDAVAAFRPDNVSDLAFDAAKARALLVGVEADTLARLEADIDFTAQIAPVLAPILSGTPRRIKRFLNALLLRLRMGDARGLQLKRRVLAKLMLLEYLKEEFFKQLAQLQAEQSGKPQQLASAEVVLRRKKFGEAAITEEPGDAETQDASVTPTQPARGSANPAATSSRTRATPSEEGLAAEIQPWLADAWMREWLSSDPELRDEDLRPYFTIAHDKTGALQGPALRLSPRATEVLNRLLDSRSVTQLLGLRDAAGLSMADAAAVFQNMAARVRQAERLDARPGSLAVVLFELTKQRLELLPQAVTLFESLPDTKITPGIPPYFYGAVEGSTSALAAVRVLERWSRSSEKRLATAARQMLDRAARPNQAL